MTTAEKRWTFITVTYNSSKALRQFWAGISLPNEIEWLVVDNCSSDGSADTAEHLGARVLRLHSNRGFGYANNVGFAESQSEYVCFVNPDITIVPADLSILEKVIDNDAKSLIAPQLRNLDHTLQPNGRGEPYLIYKILHRLNPESVAATYERYAQPGEVRRVDWLIGACVAAKRQRFNELGPWDDRFFIYYEDADLGLRNTNSDGKSLLVGDVNWTHGWARETATPNWSAWRHEIASMVKFYLRYPEYLKPPAHHTSTHQ